MGLASLFTRFRKNKRAPTMKGNITVFETNNEMV